MLPRLFLAICILTLASACAAPAKVENMVVTSADGGAPSDLSLQQAVCVNEVTGGEETDPLWTSEVDDASFRQALEGSLDSEGLLAATPEACNYEINAHLLGLAQPAFGFDIEVTAHLNYEVLRQSSGDPYFLDSVTSAYTATVDDAFVGIERLRLANEGAIRENIREFISDLKAHVPSG